MGGGGGGPHRIVDGGMGGGHPSGFLPYDLFHTITEMGSRHQINMLIIVPICNTHMYVSLIGYWCPL